MKPVEISPAANEKLKKIADFLENHWSVKVRNDFVASLEKALNDLSQNPEAFPISVKLGLRKYVIKRRTILLYKVGSVKVQIVQAFDARENYKDKD